MLTEDEDDSEEDDMGPAAFKKAGSESSQMESSKFVKVIMWLYHLLLLFIILPSPHGPVVNVADFRSAIERHAGSNTAAGMWVKIFPSFRVSSGQYRGSASH